MKSIGMKPIKRLDFLSSQSGWWSEFFKEQTAPTDIILTACADLNLRVKDNSPHPFIYIYAADDGVISTDTAGELRNRANEVFNGMTSANPEITAKPKLIIGKVNQVGVADLLFEKEP